MAVVVLLLVESDVDEASLLRFSFRIIDFFGDLVNHLHNVHEYSKENSDKLSSLAFELAIRYVDFVTIIKWRRTQLDTYP